MTRMVLLRVLHREVVGSVGSVALLVEVALGATVAERAEEEVISR
jgi:hypothetical protein